MKGFCKPGWMPHIIGRATQLQASRPKPAVESQDAAQKAVPAAAEQPKPKVRRR